MTKLTANPEAMELNARDVQSLRAQFHGRLIGPRDEGYEEARRVWNGGIDRYPALIARAADVDDIVACVRLARERDLLLAVRGGGHSVAGYGTCDGGLVLDLGAMKSIEVDPQRRVARAGPGVRLGELDRATQAYGLATPLGTVSDTGIAGLTLGGGLGWLSRPYGLTCDNLQSLELVTAEGQVLTASETENQDLFWAMRGAGANFGVVSRFEYKLHAVGPSVLAGTVIYPVAQARELLAFYADFVLRAPPQLSTTIGFGTLPSSPDVAPDYSGRKAAFVSLCYCGDLPSGEKAVKPLRTLGAPIADDIGPISWLAWQSADDSSAPAGVQNYWKSAYVQNLSAALIDLVVERIDQIPPLGRLGITQLEGAVQRIPEEKTAFGHRDARFVLDLSSAWPDPADNEQNIAWTRDLYRAIEPYAMGVYVNFLGDEGQQRVIDAYGRHKYERLVALKTEYDPTNLFRHNQNIKPLAR